MENINVKKLKQRENNFVQQHFLEIVRIIGTTCYECKHPATDVHHVSYDNLPHDNILEYCKYLVPLCRACHNTLRFKFPNKYKYPILHRRVKISLMKLNRIVQRSIGFNKRQIDFFYEYPDFKPDAFCRKAIDEQITQIDPNFLNKEEK